MSQQQDNLNQKTTVRSTIRMLISLNKQSEALEILSVVRDQIRYEPNCISSQLYRGVNDVRAIMIEELWESDQDIMHHLKSDAYQRILLVIEMADEEPDIRFETTTCLGGVEIIETARNYG